MKQEKSRQLLIGVYENPREADQAMGRHVHRFHGDEGTCFFAPAGADAVFPGMAVICTSCSDDGEWPVIPGSELEVAMTI